jgi:HEAT repeat protein
MTIGGSDNGADRSSDGALDPDDRVARRRRAVVAGHQGDTEAATALSHDPDPAVRGAALGAFWRLGILDDERLLRGLGDEDPTVRRRSCALAGRRPGPELTDTVLDSVVRALNDEEPSVVETAAWALGEFGARCGGAAVTELVRVAGSHETPVCRESAVAALGAVGAPGTLDVVLKALDDTPNIRRRAAIALAAFDDPRAEEGLRRCLADRDWQVRQAAEELLDGTEADR